MKKAVIVAALSLSTVVLFACASPEEKRNQYYQRAVSAVEAGNCVDAKLELKNVLRIDPKFHKAYILQARCDIKEKNLQKAYGSLMRAKELKEDDVEVHAELGTLYVIANDIEKASEEVEIIQKLDSSNLKGRLLAGAVALKKGRSKEGKELIKSVLDNDPKNEDAILIYSNIAYKDGEVQEALKLLERGVSLFPKNKAFQITLANLLVDQKRNDEAESVLKKLVDADANNADAVNILLKFYAYIGAPDKAQSFLQDLIIKYPNNETYRLNLAQIYLSSNDQEQARKVLEKGAADLKKSFQIRIALAKLLYQAGSKAEALSLITETAQMDVSNPQSLEATKTLAMFLSNEGRHEEALKELKSIFDRNPDDLESHFLRGRIYLVLKKAEEAISDFRQVLKQQPANAEASIMLAQAHFLNNEPSQAIQILTSVGKDSASFVQARSLLAQYYQRHGEMDKSLAVVDESLAVSPDDKGLLMLAGDLAWQKGDKEKAKKHYQKLLAQEPTRRIANVRLGLMMYSFGSFDEALKYFDAALDIDRKTIEAIEGKVLTLIKLKQYDKAASFCQKLLADLDGKQVWHELLGRVEQARGNDKVAEEQYQQAIDIDPSWLTPYLRVVGLYLSNGQIQNGIKRVEAMSAKQPQSLQLAFLLGLLYQEANDLGKAEQQYSNILEKNPDFIPAANNLAYIYAIGDGSKEKLEYGLKLALKAAKNEDPHILDTLGWIYHRLGNQEMASESLKKAYEKESENPTIAYHYAYVLAHSGSKARAKEIVLKLKKNAQWTKEQKSVDELLRTL